MTATPAWMASPVEWNAWAFPPSASVPAVGWYAPLRIFSSVLFPAPFSPINAWTLPSPTPKVIPSSARTPGKLFSTPWNWRYSADILGVGGDA